MAFRSVLRIPKHFAQQKTINRSISIMPIQCGRFRSSERFQGVENHPDVEVIHNPPEWKYVEALLPKKNIPKPIQKTEYPSGWQPQDPEKYKNLPYFVKRTRNFMLPIFLLIKYRGMRRITFIKNIEGDIEQLQQDCIDIIKSRIGEKPIYTQINEMNRTIKIKGDYVTLLQKLFYSKGL